MKNRVIQKVLSARTARNAERVAAAGRLCEKAYAIPEISTTQKEYTAAKFSALFKAGSTDTDEVNSAREKYLTALSKYGYKESDFLPVPVCEICNDTGNANGKMCACMKKEYIDTLKDECALDRRAPFSFADSKLNGNDGRTALAKLYDAMSAYVDKFPSVKYRLLVFSGATGTGKSCLASAMTRKFVTEYGRSALMLSAYELNEKLLICHTSYISERKDIMHDIMTVDFLVIDDLGTEPLLKNVTVEYLQLVLEERMRNGLSTLITTNLNAEQLLERYGERIFSRMSDKNNSLMKRIPGKDMRIEKN